MKKKAFYLAVLFVLIQFSGIAQELRCNVQILSSQIPGTNKQVFKTLQEDVYEFMNTRIWTEDEFSTQERIECKILINLQNRSGDQFSGSLTVSSRRRV